jgi:hypothetical protein
MMTLDQLIDTFETRLHALGKRIWPDDPNAAVRAEIEHMSLELQEHVAGAVFFRAAVEETRARIADQEFRAAQLASRIETYVHTGDQARAWRHALELDRVRRFIAADQAGLTEAEKAHRLHRFHIDRLEPRLEELQAQLQSRLHSASAPVRGGPRGPRQRGPWR